MMTKTQRFEALWTRYVEALSAHDVAKARSDGHARRARIGARKRAEKLHARLVREHGADLGGAL